MAMSSVMKKNLYIYLNWIIPITTITMIANITAPSKPNMNQPTRNAITENNPIIPQFTVIAIVKTQPLPMPQRSGA